MINEIKEYTISAVLTDSLITPTGSVQKYLGKKVFEPKTKITSYGNNESHDTITYIFNTKNACVWTNLKDIDFSAAFESTYCLGLQKVADCYFSNGYYKMPNGSRATDDILGIDAHGGYCYKSAVKISKDNVLVTVPKSLVTSYSESPILAFLMYSGSIHSGADLLIAVDLSKTQPELLVVKAVMTALKCSSYTMCLSVTTAIAYSYGIGFPWYRTVKDDRVALKGLFDLWNSMEWMKNPGSDKWYRCQGAYKHWALPKQHKDGYRLISAPRGELKRVADRVHAKLSEYIEANEESFGLYNTLSYRKGVDYIRSLAEKDLSIGKVGKYCLQIDLKDFFTNISPSTIKFVQLIDPITWTQYSDLFLILAELLGFTKVFAKGFLVRDRNPVDKVLSELFSLCMTNLPLWKRDLGGYNLNTGEQEQWGCKKSLRKYQQKLYKKSDFGKIVDLHNEVSPYTPMSQRGVPQGASFSGDIANLIAGTLSLSMKRKLTCLLRDFNCDCTPTTIVYSDNIYIFYDAPFNMLNIIRREFCEAYKDIRKLIVPWKILNFDRNISDVKMLGLIIDKDGDIRLSRQYRRKINQAIIHEWQNGEAWGEVEEGRKNWYEHVRQFTGDKYSRKLLEFGKGLPKKKKEKK